MSVMVKVGKQHRKEMGARIAAQLNKRGAKADLARKMDCTEAYITKICAEGPPSLDALVYVSTFLSMPLDEIVWGRGTKLPKADVVFVGQLRAIMENAPGSLTRLK